MSMCTFADLSACGFGCRLVDILSTFAALTVYLWIGVCICGSRCTFRGDAEPMCI